MNQRVQVHPGDPVFAREDGPSFGAVRVVHAHELVVDIEGYGDVVIPAEAVAAVHPGKVVVNPVQLTTDLRRAIARAHDQETR